MRKNIFCQKIRTMYLKSLSNNELNKKLRRAKGVVE